MLEFGRLLLGGLFLAGVPACAARPDPIPGRCFDPSKITSCEQLQTCGAADGCNVAATCEHSNCIMFGVDEALCKNAPDCTWSGFGCATPTPDPCAALTFDACSSNPNCATTMECLGTLVLCDSLTQPPCEDTPHCVWYPATSY